jgi:large subunit ribosomal protein L6
MSRAAKKPIIIPTGVEIKIQGPEISVKGPKGSMQLDFQGKVEIKKGDDGISFAPKKEVENSEAITGTIKALVNNMVVGVTKGFERKLILVGVGFKAQVKGKVLNLTLGFSHPVNFPIPDGITIETPSQTEVVIKGIDRQLVGQVAAKIRAFRPPEPYKGKGVKYDDEVIVRKEGKKK